VRILNKKKLIFSAALALSLIVLGIAIIIIMNARKSAGDAVIVTVKGEIVGVYSLSKNGSYELNGGTNTLTVEDGYAYIKKADCPGQQCVHQRKISRTGERIVCTHYRLSVTVEGKDEEIFIN
jgi:hypothetical protein